MNKTELIVFLRNPHKLTPSDLEGLEAVIDEAPYFLTARLLLAKGSKELKDNKTKSRVASAAIYSTDRVLLKKYLSSNLFFLGQAIAKQSIQTSKTKKERLHEELLKKSSNTAKKVGAKLARADNKHLALKERKEEPRELVIPNVPSGHLDEILEELKRDMQNLKKSRRHFIEVQANIQEQEVVPKTIKKAEIEKQSLAKESSEKEASTNKKIIDPPDAALTNQAVKKEEHESLSTTESSEEKENKPLNTQVILDPKEEEIFSKKLEKLASKKNESDRKKEINSESKEESLGEPRFSRFAAKSYLKNLSEDLDDMGFFEDDEDEEEEKSKNKTPSTAQKKNTSSKPPDTTGKEESEVEKKSGTEEVPAPPAPPTSEEEKKKLDNDEKADHNTRNDIINKFIKDSPSIKYSRKKSALITDLSEESASWDADLASETLAKICLDQGNKKRAIEIYEALVLKYPEKKSYFEELITKIK